MRKVSRVGYKPGKKLFNLEFEDHPGLEIKATSCSIGQLMGVSAMPTSLSPQNAEKVKEMFDFFSSRIVSWNLEHPETPEHESGTCPQCGLREGDSLPITTQALFCLDFDFVVSILMGWMQAVARVALPKDLNLNNGGINTEDLMRQLGELQNPSKLPMPKLS